jgi:hypothetical protein
VVSVIWRLAYIVNENGSRGSFKIGSVFDLDELWRCISEVRYSSPIRRLSRLLSWEIRHPKKDPHFEHCVENIKEKLRGFRAPLRNEASAENSYRRCRSRSVPGTRWLQCYQGNGTNLYLWSEVCTAMNLIQCQGAIHLNKRKQKRDEFDLSCNKGHSSHTSDEFVLDPPASTQSSQLLFKFQQSYHLRLRIYPGEWCPHIVFDKPGYHWSTLYTAILYSGRGGNTVDVS